MKQLFIYLSGTIRKSNDTGKLSEWTEENIQTLHNLFKQHNIKVSFLNPASRSDDLSDSFSLFGRDILQVYLSNFVIADMREKRGIGVGYEVAFANFKNIPVISWAEPNSHYRPAKCEILGQNLVGWTHPFIAATSKVSNNLEEVVINIVKHKNPSKKLFNKEDFPLPAIIHYLNTEFPEDKEMLELVQNNDYLKTQIESITKLI